MGGRNSKTFSAPLGTRASLAPTIPTRFPLPLSACRQTRFTKKVQRSVAYLTLPTLRSQTHQPSHFVVGLPTSRTRIDFRVLMSIKFLLFVKFLLWFLLLFANV
ncbi:MAG: hypothetical protein LBQ66_06840 [Planctomycetaceae bacterium]|nr:hypothetical protein [Planctomycetaceae bacterium]